MIEINKYFFDSAEQILFLHAHPDDECFLNCGLIRFLTQNKYNVYIVYCAACASDEYLDTRIRQNEAINSCLSLGVSLDKILFLDFFDKKFKDCFADRCFINGKSEDIIKNLIKKLPNNFFAKKTYIFSYDKNGGYGHLDHKKVYLISNVLHNTFNNIELYKTTINRDKIQNWLNYMEQDKQPQNKLPKICYWSKQYGISKHKIRFSFTLTKQLLQHKIKSMKFHKTQISSNEFPLSLDLVEFRNVFGTEYFY